MKIDRVDYTIFDFETTGLFAAAGDGICEIGALRLGSGGSEKRFETFINPITPISPGAYKINRITDKMLEGKPRIDEVLPGFMEFIKGSVLVAYNARFDISFLAAALENERTILNGYPVIDVLDLARKYFSVPGGYSLGNVAGYLNIPRSKEHRAMPDVIATWEIFKKVVPLLKAERIDEVEDVSRVYIQSADDACQESAVQVRLSSAIKTKRTVKITYRSSWKKKITVRTITPIKIRGEYVFSFCHLRGENRTFLIECIENVEF